jgi:hypothetical protein
MVREPTRSGRTTRYPRRPAGAGHLRLVAGLDRTIDDVRGPQDAEPLLRLAAGALADGQHRDDGRHTEDDAQDRQARPQLVQQQALHAEFQAAPHASHDCSISARMAPEE